MTAPRQDEDCPCNTKAGSTEIETAQGDVISVSACDTWGIWLELEDSGGMTQLGYDEAIQVRDALTKAIEALS